VQLGGAQTASCALSRSTGATEWRFSVRRMKGSGDSGWNALKELGQQWSGYWRILLD
jgi:hypothetical protein